MSVHHGVVTIGSAVVTDEAVEIHDPETVKVAASLILNIVELLAMIVGGQQRAV